MAITQSVTGDSSDSCSADGSCLTLVFIDCTWFQVHKIATDPRLSSKLVFMFTPSIAIALQRYYLYQYRCYFYSCGLFIDFLIQ